jgi:tRNA(Arg) A34 adenosine deaminase TadA
MFEGADIYVSVEPCGECAGFLRTLNLHGVYAGPRTKQGGDTVHRYFTKRISDDDCPTGDVYGEMGLPYYPMPQIVQFGILQDKFRALIEEGQQWRNFIAKKFAMYA